MLCNVVSGCFWRASKPSTCSPCNGSCYDVQAVGEVVSGAVLYDHMGASKQASPLLLQALKLIMQFK